MINSKKLLVVVPYRDREDHLNVFIPYISSTLNQQNINNKIVIVEQSDHSPFNRGLLCNIGFSLFYRNFDYVCFHDIDMIGEDFDYSYEDSSVIHLSFNRKVVDKYIGCYNNYLGGVVIFNTTSFLQINGFSNNYWGWGCEDDDLRLRCITFNLNILHKKCHYQTLPHESLKDKKLYTQNYNFMLKQFQYTHDNRIIHIKNDGVNECISFCKNISILENQNYSKIKCYIETPLE